MSTPNPTGFGMHAQDELNDLRMSDKAVPLLEHVKRFCEETVKPMAEKFEKLGEGRAPGQLELLDGAKNKAQERDCGTSSCPTPRPARACPTWTTPTSPPSWARTRWLRVPELLGARHRQHGGARAVGTPEQKERG
jgi:hypothetical protein